jgi:hypothetical protein
MDRLGTVTAVVLALSGAPALAADWGKVDNPDVCTKTSGIQGQIHYYPECQAAVDKLLDGCMGDPAMKDKLAKGGWVDGKNVSKVSVDEGKKYPANAVETCEGEILVYMSKAREQGDLEKAEMPKPTWKNPAVEKMIQGYFKQEYKDGEKLLKIMLQPDKPAWEIEKDGLGKVKDRAVYAAVVFQKGDVCSVHKTYYLQAHNGKTFAGPLEEHGAGAEVNYNILCTKVK